MFIVIFYGSNGYSDLFLQTLCNINQGFRLQLICWLLKIIDVQVYLDVAEIQSQQFMVYTVSPKPMIFRLVNCPLGGRTATQI